ncbi:c-type cytochrome [Achromobacter sp. UMC71]|uniref:c-type cytochrome n=1 Tax=Achromobacter sp. UMC71 TaxID=1862320 RepID=UPI0015FEEA38|nr:c-type cytochrome [Achromobacter sp. UMC71]MBB1623837.1 cytochrome C oxidase Cbb3 [Achromobacter sp. UMC71]
MSHLPHAAALPPDLLHGLALRPPRASWDGARYRGNLLASADVAGARGMAGVVDAVRHGHFAGVVAMTPLQARQAAAAFNPVWQSGEHEKNERLPDTGQADYRWRMAADPSGAAARVAVWCLNGHAGVWLPACPQQVQRQVRHELAELLQWPETAIRVTLWRDDSSDGDDAPVHALGLLDAAADAALLSQAVGRPVCVACQPATGGELVLHVMAQAETSITEPATASPATTIAASGPKGLPQALVSDTPWAVRPSLARLLSRPGSAPANAYASVRTDLAVQAARGACGPAQAGVDDLDAAQVFAQESLWHEQALAQGEDPLAWRLRHLPAGPGSDLARQVAEQAGSVGGDAVAQGADGRLWGRGFATATAQCVDEAGEDRVVWSAWVAEVAVQPRTGHIEVTRVIAGHDSRQLQAAQGACVHPEITHQAPQWLEGARRLVAPSAAFDDWGNADAGVANALTTRAGSTDLSRRDPNGIGPLSHGRLDVDGVVTLPAAAAIANAIQDATGVRLRQAPFQPEQLRLALADRGAESSGKPWRRGWGWLAAGAASLAGLAVMAWPMKPALPLTAGPDVTLYSPQAIARGRLVAAAGDCVVCHTAPGGAANAGGFALETPFGTVYSTNITPDNDTGIGRWSFAAFDRAMRQGIHQDGRQLYPAFPYTAFAKLSDADMQALYGYLMSQPAVASKPPETKLAFPYNLRPMIAGWNLLFHNAAPYSPDPAYSVEWNRGAYLVQGAGHCAACHSPRNSLGAEKAGLNYLSGGEAEGWTAPPLNRLADGTLPWTREGLFQYLRTGYSPRHGVAAGPMAPVIHGLAELPESDVRAMVTYLMDLPDPAGATRQAAAPSAAPAGPVPAAQAAQAPATDLSSQFRQVNGERIYQNACAACHEAGSGPTLFGAKPLLGLNTNLHAATPDNLIQVILHGIQAPANDELGYMPGFKDSLDDPQIADLIDYLRERFAPEEKHWPVDMTMISRLREHAPSQ